MPISSHELDSLTASIREHHGDTAIALACLVHVSTNRLNDFRRDHLPGVRVLRELNLACVRVYAHRVGVAWSDVKDALEALERAGEVAGYLHTMPD